MAFYEGIPGNEFLRVADHSFGTDAWKVGFLAKGAPERLSAGAVVRRLVQLLADFRRKPCAGRQARRNGSIERLSG
jgi:hypothetical protein